jgi:hypothetical protein
MGTTTHDNLSVTSQDTVEEKLQTGREIEGKGEPDTTSPVEASPFLHRVVRVIFPSPPSVRVSIDPAREEEKALIRRVNRSR